ncbi:hypothetical protein P3X83_09555 [Spongiactinospora sp. TRM90649]|nr:hypothetical protein [Spongiactinospora sp. TRM90649]
MPGRGTFRFSPEPSRGYPGSSLTVTVAWEGQPSWLGWSRLEIEHSDGTRVSVSTGRCEHESGEGYTIPAFSRSHTFNGPGTHAARYRCISRSSRRTTGFQVGGSV